MNKNTKNFYKNKKILITGHTGFKGAWLTQILLNCESNITGISLPPGTSPSLFEILKVKNKVKNYFIDIRNFDKIKKVFFREKPEIVFHLAAQAIVMNSYDDPLKTHSTNIIGTANILQATKEIKTVKSAIIITTDKVYENKEWVYPYRENDPLGGYDPYSASKAAADIIAHSYIKSFFNIKDFNKKHNTLIAIARAGNVIGGGDWAKDRLIADIIRAIYEKNEKIIIRNSRSIRPWEHVMEPLLGYLLLVKGLYEGRTDFVGAWNFGPNNESFVCVKDLVKSAIKILGKGELKVKKDGSKHEVGILKLDTTKSKCILNWKPILNFEESLKFTFDWYKNYYENKENPIKFTNNQINYFLGRA